MEKGYPRRTVNDFPGISQKVDAVFQHKGKWKKLWLLSKISLLLKSTSSGVIIDVIIGVFCKR